MCFDIDPIRPAGISSSEVELEASVDRAKDIRDSLTAIGWPVPILACSGNGAHLLVRIDLPPDDGGLVADCLGALAGKFDNREVKVDTTVHNPARIWKVYGTTARKGDSTPDRPHRRASLLEVPEDLVAVPKPLLEKLAAEAPREVPVEMGQGTIIDKRSPNNGHFDLGVWIADHRLEVDGPTAWQGGRRWIFPVCPWEDSHTGGSAYLLQLSSGAIVAGCQHNSCADRIGTHCVTSSRLDGESNQSLVRIWTCLQVYRPQFVVILFINLENSRSKETQNANGRYPPTRTYDSLWPG